MVYKKEPVISVRYERCRSLNKTIDHNDGILPRPEDQHPAVLSKP
jgi:hypothetical protein